MNVDPAELQRFGHRISDLSGQCVTAADYEEKYLSIGVSDVGSIFLPVLQQLDEIRDVIVANIDSIRHLTETSAQSLVDAAKQYRAQEATNAGQLDGVGSWFP
ncbi:MULTISPECIES: type VII secretion target [unclassified Rhodococcus (in: high G+C Gram-positive bacteria)]|nr:MULTISPECIES: type VII secretion target [unclassified Rhodococcus (in: high G+C Gram-positive bacteria)]